MTENRDEESRFWLNEICRAFRASGLSYKTFAEMTGIPELSLRRWVNVEQLPNRSSIFFIKRGLNRFSKMPKPDIKFSLQSREIFRKLRDLISLDEKNYLLDSADPTEYRAKLIELCRKHSISIEV
jgi:hypothetical protein